MLYNNVACCLVYIDFDTLQSPVQIFNISLHFAIRGQLVASQVRIMGTETVVVVEWMCHVLIDLSEGGIQHTILIGEYESAETVQTQTGCFLNGSFHALRHRGWHV